MTRKPITPSEADDLFTPQTAQPIPSRDGPHASSGPPRHRPGPPKHAGSDHISFRSAAAEIAHHLADLVAEVRRIAETLDPPPPDTVGSSYVASRLGCTTTWVAELARKGAIPLACVVPGTGDGKPWKFFRSPIDEWIASR